MPVWFFSNTRVPGLPHIKPSSRPNEGAARMQGRDPGQHVGAYGALRMRKEELLSRHKWNVDPRHSRG